MTKAWLTVDATHGMFPGEWAVGVTCVRDGEEKTGSFFIDPKRIVCREYCGQRQIMVDVLDKSDERCIALVLLPVETIEFGRTVTVPLRDLYILYDDIFVREFVDLIKRSEMLHQEIADIFHVGTANIEMWMKGKLLPPAQIRDDILDAVDRVCAKVEIRKLKDKQ